MVPIMNLGPAVAMEGVEAMNNNIHHRVGIIPLLLAWWSVIVY